MDVLTAAAAAMVFGVPGTALLVTGLVLARRSKLDPSWVPVQAVVVEYANFTRPHRVTFDYPLPNGSWARATKVATTLYTQEGTSSVLIAPGERFTAYVNPADPQQVSLGAYGAARVLPWILVGFGSLLLALVVVAVVLVVVSIASS